MPRVCRIPTVLLLGLLCLCGSAHAAHAAQMTVNKIAAVVNGEMITLHELRSHTAAEMARQRMADDDPRVPVLQQQVLDSLINNILFRQEARRYKLSANETEEEAEVKKIMAGSKLSPERFDAELKKQGMSRQMLKKRISDTMLRQQLSTFMIVRKIIVTKEEVEQYYEAHKDEFSGQQSADFSIVMLPEKLNVQSIYQQIRSGALKMEEAAVKYSADKSSKQAGRVVGVPWTRLPGDMQKLLSSLKDGQLSPLLRTQGGFVLIRRDGLSPAKPLTLQEATPRIEEILRAPRLEERFKEYTSQLRSKAVVDIRI